MNSASVRQGFDGGIGGGVFAAAVFTGILIAGRSAVFGDPGAYWHIDVGRLLAEKREWIQTDPFSFTMSGRAWFAMLWVGELFMYYTWNLLGFDGLLAGAAAIIGWTYGRLAGNWIRAGCHWITAGALLFLVLAASSHHFLVRPHLISIALMAWTTEWLAAFEKGERSSFRSVLVLFTIYVFWTNVHAGALGGLTTIGMAAVGWTIAGCFGWPVGLVDRRHLKLAWMAAALASVSIFINPYGWKLPQVWLLLSTSQALPGLLKEHGRLNPLQTPDLYGVVLAVLYLAVLLGIPVRQWRVSWLLAIPWLGMACDRIRHMPLFAAVAGVALADMLGSCRWLARWSERGSDLFRVRSGQIFFAQSRWERLVIPLCFAATSTAIVVLRGFPEDRDKSILAKAHPRMAPAALLKPLRQELDSQDKPTPIFNDLNLGGFIIHFLRPHPVYIDDRFELYGAEFMGPYCRARDGDPSALDGWLERYGIRHAVVEREGGFHRRLRDVLRWRVLAETETAAALIAP